MKTIEWNTTTEILDVIDKLEAIDLVEPNAPSSFIGGYLAALRDVRAAVLKIREDLDEYPDPDYPEPEFDDE